MKNTINICLFWLVIAVCTLGCLTRKQQNVVAIQNNRQNILYSCVANSITVAAENIPCRDILLETDNGTIRTDSFRPPGHYTIWPDKLGNATVIVKRKKGRGYVTIGQMPFRVRRFEASARFLGKNEGELSTIEVRESVAPATVILGGDFCGHYLIDSFTITVIRDGEEIFKKRLYDMNGARFDDTTRNFLATVKQRDKLFFSEITCKDLCRQSVKLGDMEFVISNAHEKRPEHGQEIRIDPITGQEVIKKW